MDGTPLIIAADAETSTATPCPVGALAEMLRDPVISVSLPAQPTQARFRILSANTAARALIPPAADGDQPEPIGQSLIDWLGLKPLSAAAEKVIAAVTSDQPTRLHKTLRLGGTAPRHYEIDVLPPAETLQPPVAVLHLRDVTSHHQQLESTVLGISHLLGDLADLRSPTGHGHTQRLRRTVTALARRAGIGMGWTLELAITLSHMGDLIVPRAILGKIDRGEALDPGEAQIVEQAPVVASELLGRIPRLAPVARVLHLRGRGYDGSGAPDDGPEGADLPQESRLLCLADAILAVQAAHSEGAAALAALAKQRHRFDPKLWPAAEALLANWHRESRPTEPIEVDILQLKAGDVLAQELRNGEGVLLLSSGSELSAAMVNRIIASRQLWHLPQSVRVRRDGAQGTTASLS